MGTTPGTPAAPAGSAGPEGSAVPAWDLEVDLLVAGTGAGGLVTAVTGADRGLDVLLVESTAAWGGTSAVSGGGLWMPDNQVMEAHGLHDSPEAALAYLEDVVGRAGDVGPASSRERKVAFLGGVRPVVELLTRLGVRFAPALDYPDYYPDRPGGAVGRGIEVEPYDSRRLGAWFRRSRYREAMPPMALMTDDVWLLARSWSTWSGFTRAARMVGRTALRYARGHRPYGMGMALVCSLMEVVQRQGTPVWLEAPVTDLVVEGEGAARRVTGAVLRREGRDVRVRARAGVVLASGGFARRADLRTRHQGVPGWTSAPEGDQGSAVGLAERAGAQLALMDDAWWGAAVPMPDGSHLFALWERSLPFSLMVDATGRRFTNESASYIDVGHAMLERDLTAPRPGAWLVTDARHSRRYLFTALLKDRAGLRGAGTCVTAPTLAALAEAMDVDPGVLDATVTRFNGFARAGVDDDFGRGATAYDRYYSDPRVRPNPTLGPLERGPFTAVRLVPGDLGTKGGLLTDVHGRAVGHDDEPVAGLYATGNATASVMGRTYPGPGATLAPAVVFGHLAAVHAADHLAAATTGPSAADERVVDLREPVDLTVGEAGERSPSRGW